ncbi:MAG: ABC transporter ATP-binding protein [Planctomycetes bacterium]|nr:ABC transporter ATP-binding protein [Planctomycetota bacterium]
MPSSESTKKDSEEKAAGQSTVSMARILRRILSFVRPHRGLLIRVYLYLFLVLLCELAGPAILGKTIDLLVAFGTASEASSRDQHFSGVVAYGLAFLAAGLLGQALNFRKEFLRTRLNTEVLCDIRIRLYDAIQRLCFRYHDANHSGDLITKATRDVYHVHTLYAETIFLGAEIVILVAGALVLILITDWRLALLSFSTFPFAAAIVVRAAERMRQLSRAASDQYDCVTRVLQENISGVRVVKAFAREPAEIEKFSRETSTFLERSLLTVRTFTLNLPLAGTLFNLAIPITLLGGALLAGSGAIRVGQIAAAIFYLSKISNVLRMLNRVVQTLQEAASGGDRFFTVLDAEPHVKEPAAPKPLPEGGRGEVVLDGVHFAYQPGAPVLRGVSLRIDPGKRTAIVGPTGCGKSSLASLIPRFYEVQEGRILIDGVDIRDVPLAELRRVVSPIFQDTFLFSMSIAENIAFGRPDAAREEIERCARAAQIHDFIAGLEAGYDTIIGERGMSLSGGQKQRISIARAFLMNPRLLIMDDCTASVDAETEKKLQAAMAALSRGRTTIIIAQRFSSVVHADHIVFLDRGKVAAIGAHAELLEICPLYRQLYEMQVQITAGAAGAAV